MGRPSIKQDQSQKDHSIEAAYTLRWINVAQVTQPLSNSVARRLP